MKGLGVSLGLAVLLSVLLLVVTEPSLAGKPNPGKNHTPPAKGHQKQKAKGGQKTTGGQQSKTTPGAKDPAQTAPISPTQTITLCHKPGTPAEKTLVLPASAGPGHLQHGDYEGPCQEMVPTVPTLTLPLSATQMITICHKPGTPAEKTLVVPATAWSGHSQHGDELDACPDPAAATPVHRGRQRKRH